MAIVDYLRGPRELGAELWLATPCCESRSDKLCLVGGREGISGRGNSGKSHKRTQPRLLPSPRGQSPIGEAICRRSAQPLASHGLVGGEAARVSWVPSLAVVLVTGSRRRCNLVIVSGCFESQSARHDAIVEEAFLAVISAACTQISPIGRN